MKPLSQIALVMLVAAGPSVGSAQQPFTARDSARHALDRLGYGPTPGKVDEVARIGVQRWIELQLAQRSITDPALRAREAASGALTTPTRELVAMHADQVSRAVRAQAARPDSTAPRRPTNEMQREAAAGGRRDLRALNGDLMSLTLERAVASDRQLGEVMADFWLNHFNVFINKGFDRAYFRDYLERTIRANALGTFPEILVATAKSPAMLFYLDNVQSVADGSAMAPRARAMRRGGAAQARPDPAMVAAAQQRAPRGLNENYARELLELHTLGVDGGYTQADVVNVARILTGWTLGRRDASPGFTFNTQTHDRGEKTVLGVRFPAGAGVDEGERLLAMLASHPATMHHIAAKLCARFVADAPPDGCIDDAVRAWKQSGGDIRTILRAIVRSPDFWAPANVRNKTKSPLEFVVSAIRAIGATPDATPRLALQVGRLGQPLFQQSAPVGYPETQADWVNSGSLLARMNFAVALAAGRVPGVAVDLDRIIPTTSDHGALVAAVDRVILGGSMTERTRGTIVRELAEVADPRDARALAVGLAIGGPEFQRQ